MGDSIFFGHIIITILIIISIAPWKRISLDQNDGKSFITFSQEKLYDWLISPSYNKFPYSDTKKSKCTTTHVSAAKYIFTVILLTSGDIHTNPGPKNVPKYPCVSCHKAVRSNSKAIECDICTSWTHLKCSDINVSTYNECVSAGKDLNFVCKTCSFKEIPFTSLPFHDDNDGPVTQDFQVPLLDSSNLESNHHQCSTRKGLVFVHLNARSLINKVDQLRILAESTKASIIGVTETWLDNTISDSEISIPDFSIVRNDRDRHGGGVCVYVKDNINFNCRNDIFDVTLETIFLDIVLPKTKPIIVGICYRPPTCTNFFSKLEECIVNSERYIDLEIIILGDFNVNVLNKKKSCSLHKSLANFQRSLNLTQLITEPTRICQHSSTIIDLVFVTDKDNINSSGILPYALSDHYAIFCCRKLPKLKFNSHRTVKIRSMKNYSINIFHQALNAVDWSRVTNVKDTNQALDLFYSLLNNVINQVAPIKEIRIKQKSEPWITNEILESILDRDSQFKTYKKTRTPESYQMYCKARNKVIKLIKTSKINYLNNLIEEAGSCPKKMWKALKELNITNKSKTQTSNIGLRNEGGEIIFEKNLVANKLNKYFAEI
jgi:hypothetical protein